MASDLFDLLGDQESAVLEFKETQRDKDKIGQTICALANDLGGNGGGDLLIGVHDSGEPLGNADVSDRTLLQLNDLRDSGLILDRPSIVVDRGVFKSRPVIRVKVTASTTPPVRFKGVVYVRPGPTTRRATREDERVLSERRRSFDGPFDGRTVVGTCLDDLDLPAFRSTYLPSVVDYEVIEENGRPEVLQLASLGLANLSGVPTVLGHLVLGFDPSKYIPGAYVQFIRYDGTDLDAPIADDQELRYNINDLARQLDAVLKGHLHTQIVDDEGFKERTHPDYPFAALREACMNAVMHRNYETSYAPTRIAWFSDRIEITNPGGPFGQVRADNFDRVSDFRNPSLAAAMKSLGYVNRFGRGIGRIRKTLEGNGNPSPVFIVDNESWSVTMRRVT